MGRFTAAEGPALKPCAGPCGRMTRPNKAPAARFPNTVSRASGAMCSACHNATTMAAKTADQLAAEAAAKRRVQEERVAAAHKARETLEAQRRERQAKAGRAHLARQLAIQRGLISA